MSVLVRILAWLLAAAVAFVTLGPPGLRPHSGLGQDGEHALAFILVGLAFGLAYRNHRWPVAGVAVAMIGLLEVLQLWAPGRHARVEDFLVDAATACAGLVLAAACDWVLTRLRSGSAAMNEGPAE